MPQWHHTEDALFLAEGDFMGMNGNYGVGILAGVAYFYRRLNNG